jgi:cytochrome P450
LCHRDDETLGAAADHFAPELWTDGGRPPEAALVPFSAGPAECAGRNLVLLVASTMLAALLQGHRFRLEPPGRLDAGRPLPGTLDPFRLRFVAQRH